MKKILFSCFAAVGLLHATASAPAVAADTNQTANVQQKKVAPVTRGDVKIIEATENIRYISQQMAKEYLFLFKTPRKEATEKRLKRSLIELGKSLKVIGATTKDSDTRDILEFLAYSKDQIAQIFMEPVNEERAALMLDYSETLLEGADSIAAAHAYDFTREERMLIVTKKMEYLVERMMKYYIALHVGFDNPTNKEQMKEAIGKFDENMQIVASYEYPKDVHSVKQEMMRAWRANRGFLKRSEALFIPKLMLLSTRSLEELTEQIALYHNKNQ